MFGWLKRRTAKLQPEARWSIRVDTDSVHVSDPVGDGKSLAKDDLNGVAIETNDSGPWGADVWWLLFGGDDQLACAFPQGANGESAVLDFLTSLPRFDHEQMAQAMCSTRNAIFPVWRRGD